MQDPTELDGGRARTMLGRALRLRCPVCGSGSLRRHWLAFLPVCPRCALRLDRGQPDFFIGAYLVNLIVAELIVAGFIGLVAIATWPGVPWTAMLYGGAGLAVLGPLLTYPFSRLGWLAIDLTFQPAGPPDFAAAVDVAPTGTRYS
jgi:uncharacterized protein (DUF983 family)